MNYEAIFTEMRMMIELNGTSMLKHNHNSELQKPTKTSDVRSNVNEHAECWH